METHGFDISISPIFEGQTIDMRPVHFEVKGVGGPEVKRTLVIFFQIDRNTCRENIAV